MCRGTKAIVLTRNGALAGPDAAASTMGFVVGEKEEEALDVVDDAARAFAPRDRRQVSAAYAHSTTLTSSAAQVSRRYSHVGDAMLSLDLGVEMAVERNADQQTPPW